jgi:UDP:flavonoid glycosyltransferase YjiC (YdhE family)
MEVKQGSRSLKIVIRDSVYHYYLSESIFFYSIDFFFRHFFCVKTKEMTPCVIMLDSIDKITYRLVFFAAHLLMQIL